MVKVLSGVPQRSVLSPLLFLIHTDEVGTIPMSVETEQVMFADDLLLYKPIAKSSDYLDVQADVNRVKE